EVPILSLGQQGLTSPDGAIVGFPHHHTAVQDHPVAEQVVIIRCPPVNRRDFLTFAYPDEPGAPERCITLCVDKLQLALDLLGHPCVVLIDERDQLRRCPLHSHVSSDRHTAIRLAHVY